MIPGAFCSTCVFFSPGRPTMRDRVSGQCRRHAPILDQSELRLRTIWPLVMDDSWCGEHATVDAGE